MEIMFACMLWGARGPKTRHEVDITCSVDNAIPSSSMLTSGLPTLAAQYASHSLVVVTTLKVCRYYINPSYALGSDEDFCCGGMRHAHVATTCTITKSKFNTRNLLICLVGIAKPMRFGA